MGQLTGQKIGKSVESRASNRKGKRKRKLDPHEDPELSPHNRAHGIIIHEENEDGSEVTVFIPWKKEKEHYVNVKRKEILTVNWDNETSRFNSICHVCRGEFHTGSEFEKHTEECLGRIHENSADRLGKFLAHEKAKASLGGVQSWIRRNGQFRTEGTTVIARAKITNDSPTRIRIAFDLCLA